MASYRKMVVENDGVRGRQTESSRERYRERVEEYTREKER